MSMRLGYVAFRAGEMLVLGGLVGAVVVLVSGGFSLSGPLVAAGVALVGGIGLVVAGGLPGRRLNRELARRPGFPPAGEEWLEWASPGQRRRFADCVWSHAGAAEQQVRAALVEADLGAAPDVLGELVAVVQRSPRFDVDAQGKGTMTVGRHVMPVRGVTRFSGTLGDSPP